MATTTEVLVKNPVLNDIPKSIYDTITPATDEIYAVDMEYTGNKVVVTDANGDLVESGTNSAKLAYIDNITGDVQTQLNSKVSDVTVSGTSVVNNSGVAEIPVAENNGDYGLVKLAGGYGLTKQGTQGFLYITKATDNEVAAKSNNYKPIVPASLDYAVKVAVTTNTNPLSATEKSDACDWIGALKDATIDSTSIVSNGVAVIPNASASVYGVTKLSANLTSISDTIAATASMGNNLAQNIITGVGTYSTTSTYAVGDKTRKGQYYYECITPITSGHDWDANEWKQITIQEQIDASVGDVTINGTSIVSNRIAEIPIAQTAGDYGLVKLSSDSSGIMLSNNGTLQTRRATDNDIIAKTQINRPIVPANLDLAIREGLGNNSLTWDTTYQTSARNTIGATQVVIREWD